MSEIRIISSKNIDREKWDACIEQNENGLIYARSFYLDAMAKYWDGLIVDDYKGVMPLVWDKKLGIKYIRLFALIQQLGFVGDLTEDLNIISRIHTHYPWYGTIAFNFLNKSLLKDDFTFRTNLILPLNQTYSIIYQTYSPTLRQRIRKANANDLNVVDVSYMEVVNRYQQFILETKKLSKDLIPAFDKFKYMLASLQKDYFIAKKVISKKNETLAMGLYLKDNKRVYNMMSVTEESGRTAFATHFLIDHMIKTFAGSKMIFDFEGSEIPGVKEFYNSFSPVNQPYFLYKYNHLPWPFKNLR